MVKRSDKNIKKELGDDYIEPARAQVRKEIGKGVYVAIGVGVLFVLVIAVVLIFRSKKTEK